MVTKRSDWAGRRLALATILLGSALLTTTGQRLEAVPPSERAVGLLTWNVGTVNPMDVRLPNRFEHRVAKTIVDAKVKVVCLQEVQSLAQARRLRDLIVAKGGPVYSVVSSASNPKREDGRATAMLYLGDASKAPVFKASTGDQAQALFLDGVTVVNLHAPAGEYKNRQTFYPELAKWIKTLPQPVVLAGDFNIGPKGGAGMAAVLPWLKRKDKKLFRDLIAGFSGRTTLGPTTMYGLIFDHVMTTDGRVTKQRVVKGRRSFPMDHDPIVTELSIPLPKKPETQSAPRCGAIGVLSKAGPH